MNVLLLIDSLPDSLHSVFVRNVLAAFSSAHHQMMVLYTGNEQRSFFERFNARSLCLGGGIVFTAGNRFWEQIIPERFRKLRIETSIPTYVKMWEVAIADVLCGDASIDMVYLLSGCGFYYPGVALLRLQFSGTWMIHAEMPLSHHPLVRDRLQLSSSLLQASAMRLMTFAEADYITCSSRRVFSRMHFYEATFRRKLLYLPFAAQKRTHKYEESSFRIFYCNSFFNRPMTTRFLTGFSQMIVSLNDDERAVIELDVCGEIGSVGDELIKRLGLAKYVRVIPKEQSEECARRGTTLLHIEEEESDSWGFSPFFPDFVASDRPVIALVQPNSETGSLLGEHYPFVSTGMSEESIYFVLMEAFIAWQQSRTKGLFPKELPYLLSFENFNVVIDMAMRCRRDRQCAFDISSHEKAGNNL